MYINLTEDQLSTLLEALVDAQDDKLEEAKYTTDREDKADLLAAAESFGDLRQDLYQQSESEREAGTNKIHVVLSIDKDTLAKHMNDEESLGDSISRELKWLQDSGMHVDSWSFAQDDPKPQPERAPLVTEGVLKLYDDELRPIPRKKDLTTQIQGAEGKREQSAPTPEEKEKDR